MLTVKDLREQIDTISPSYLPLAFEDLQYEPVVATGRDGLVNRRTGQIFAFDDEVFANFTKFIGVPAKFAEKLPVDLRVNVINHFMEQEAGQQVTLTHFGEQFQNIFEERTTLLPPRSVMEMVGRVFQDSDVVSKIDFRDGLVLNIRTAEFEKAVKPGDLTQGGIRFNALHGKTPTVSPYMERLVCSNGMVVASDIDSISLRGFTVAEVIENMERMAQIYLRDNIPAYLDNWARLTDIKTPNPEQLIHRLSKEGEISPKIETRIIEAAAALIDNTYYDIVNLITSFQHEEGVNEEQYYKIQRLGGAAVRDLGGHRCSGCQHSLDF